MVTNGDHTPSVRKSSPVRAMHARCMSEPPVSIHARRFGVEPDIDSVENHRRKVPKDPPARRSHTEVEATMQAFGVGLDIDAAEHHRRKIVGQDRQYSRDNFQVLPDVDVSHSWDLPLGGMVKGPKAERRPFWEQTHWAEQWARLLERPRRGNRNSVWQAEVPPALDTWDDLPEDVRADLHAIKCELDGALAKKHGRTKVSSSPAQPTAKPVKESPVPKIWEALYESPWRESLANAIDIGHGKPLGSSSASTASGDAICAPSPEVASTAPGTARSAGTDTDSENSVFHIVNDPKGRHALLRQATDDRVAASCQRLHFPLGLRRVMCALNPADAESSLELTGDQMRKLTGLRCALRTQKHNSTPRKPRPFS